MNQIHRGKTGISIHPSIHPSIHAQPQKSEKSLRILRTGAAGAHFPSQHHARRRLVGSPGTQIKFHLHRCKLSPCSLLSSESRWRKMLKWLKYDSRFRYINVTYIYIYIMNHIHLHSTNVTNLLERYWKCFSAQVRLESFHCQSGWSAKKRPEWPVLLLSSPDQKRCSF